MSKCTCDARFSGVDEQEYAARGCPECVCEHKNCGLGDVNGPYEQDCSCRMTDKSEACAAAGCGFCEADRNYN